MWNEGWSGLYGVSPGDLLRGPLVLTPLRGEALADRDVMGKQDPYVRAYLAGAEHKAKRTKTVSGGGRNPAWRPEHDPVLTLSAPEGAAEPPGEAPLLHVEVMDEDVLSDDVIGTWSCPLAPLAHAVAKATEPGEAGGAQPVLQEDGRLRLRVPLRYKGKAAGVLHALLAFTVPEAPAVAETPPADTPTEPATGVGAEGGAVAKRREEAPQGPSKRRPGKPKRPGKAKADATEDRGEAAPGDGSFARSGKLFVVVKEVRNLPSSGLMAVRAPPRRGPRRRALLLPLCASAAQIDPYVRCCLLPWRRKTGQTGVRSRAGPNPRWSAEDENHLSLPYPGFEAFLLQHAADNERSARPESESGLPVPVAQAQRLVFSELNAPCVRVEAWDKDTFSDDLLAAAEVRRAGPR